MCLIVFCYLWFFALLKDGIVSQGLFISLFYVLAQVGITSLSGHDMC